MLLNKASSRNFERVLQQVTFALVYILSKLSATRAWKNPIPRERSMCAIQGPPCADTSVVLLPD